MLTPDKTLAKLIADATLGARRDDFLLALDRAKRLLYCIDTDVPGHEAFIVSVARMADCTPSQILEARERVLDLLTSIELNLAGKP